MAEQIEALKSLRPDIVALQEVTLPILDSYPPLLSSLGLHYIVNSFDLSKEQDQLKGPRRYGQLIASRWRLSAMKPDLFPVPWKERVLSAKVITPRGNIEFHTTHIPPGSSNGWIKIVTLEGIYQRLARQTKIPRILCGDFNAPQEERQDG